MRFALDHKRDFDAILNATDPFALVRFGDGEAALLTGRPHLAASGEWQVREAGPHWLQGPLMDSLTRVAEGFCVGLPSGCCLRDCAELHHMAKAPKEQRTFATLFLHGNLDRMRELVKRFDPLVVGRMGEINVPADGVEKGCDFEPIVTAMLNSWRPMFVSAGPLANVIIDLYWQRQDPARRQMVLDVGSALDRYLTGKSTRYYHRGILLSHHCTLGGAPLVAGVAAIQPLSTFRQGATPMPVTEISNRSAEITEAQIPSQRSTHRGPTTVVQNGNRRRRPGTVRTAITMTPAQVAVSALSAAAQVSAPEPEANAAETRGPTVGAPGQKKKCTTCVRIMRRRR